MVRSESPGLKKEMIAREEVGLIFQREIRQKSGAINW